MKVNLIQTRITRWGVAAALVLPIITTQIKSAQAYFDGPAYAFPVPNYVVDAIGQSAMSNANASLRKESGKGKTNRSKSNSKKGATTQRKTTQAATPIASAAQRQQLYFKPSAELTRKSDAEFAKFLKDQVPQDQDYIMRELNKGSYRRIYADIIGPSKLESNNLADVLAAYMVVSWGILNDKPNVGRPLDVTATRAVRSSLRNKLALDPKFHSLSNSHKQSLAENLTNLTTLYVTSNADFRKANDSTTLNRFRNVVRNASKNRVGLDLTTVRLTSTGFSK
jgi:hypothetical protein